MVCSCVLYYDEIIIYDAKLFLPFSSELFLCTAVQHVFVSCIRWPRMDISNKNTQQTLFSGSCPLNFVQNIS